MAVYQPDRSLLTQQIRTIQDQDIRDWTCIVGIDGHDMCAESAIREIVAGDGRFVVHNFDNNVGFYRNFERLLTLVDPNCSWVALADQDDAWDRGKIRRLSRALGERDVQLAVCQARIVNESGAAIGQTSRREVPLATLILDNQVTGSLAVFSPALLRIALPFPEPGPSSYHDHWLGVVASATGRYVIVSETLQSYVQHAGNVIGEARGLDLAVRMRRLVDGGPSLALRRLSHERWGWRHRMAQELIRRCPEVGADAGVRAIADGALSIALVRELTFAIRTGAVGPLRAASLALGAAVLAAGGNRVTAT